MKNRPEQQEAGLSSPRVNSDNGNQVSGREHVQGLPSKASEQKTAATYSKNNSRSLPEQNACVLSVLQDIAIGGLDELNHHPVHVAGEAAAGAGVAVGLSMVAPEVALLDVGAAAGIYVYGRHFYCV
jgi:hypothetical protein